LKKNGPKNITPKENILRASHICLVLEAKQPELRVCELAQKMMTAQKMTGLRGQRIRLEMYCHVDLDRLMEGGY